MLIILILINISNLRTDGAWGGNQEIVALSTIFNSPIEVYRDSDVPGVYQTENVTGINPLRLFYRNHHYSSIRTNGGLVKQLFNFQGLQPGELELQMANLREANEFQGSIDLLQYPDAVHDPQNALAIQQSNAIQQAWSKYMKFYASRIIVKLPEEQN